MKTDPTPDKKPEDILEEGKKQLEWFQGELTELKEKAVHLGEEARKEFDLRATDIEELYDDALKGYNNLKSKTETGWEEARDFVVLTNKALKHSFNYFLSHYKKREK